MLRGRRRPRQPFVPPGRGQGPQETERPGREGLFDPIAAMITIAVATVVTPVKQQEQFT